MTRPTVLLGARVASAFATRLAERYEVLGPLAPPFADTVRSLPAAEAGRVRALVTMGAVATSQAALDALPALGLVACVGSGYEGVDLAAARARRIAITHSPGANASAVADLAVGLLIASVRRFSEGQAFLKSGQWAGNYAHRMPIVRGLTGRRLGVFGLGEIGLRIARRAQAFEMDVGYHNRRPRDDVAYPYFATLPDLAAWADVLVVAVRASAATRHAVDAGVLAALGAEGHVVNIARGSVIDEAALVAALAAGTIAGAGLDVYEHEPQVPAALVALPNVVLLPHVGGGTLEAQAAMQDMVWANLDAFFAGRPLVTPVTDTGGR
ncbi:MAG: 2-hydroxyacid dehydrogenase [Burkholderiales bacterium]